MQKIIMSQGVFGKKKPPAVTEGVGCGWGWRRAARVPPC